MEIFTFVSSETLGDKIAEIIIKNIITTENSKYILGLPTGYTPIPILKSFIEQASKLSERQKKVIAQKLFIVVMDDFIELNKNLNINSSDKHSALGFMNLNFINPLNKILNNILSLDHILYPKPGDTKRLKNEIINFGGIDLFILATDPVEGYVAQNFSNQEYYKTENQKIGALDKNFLKHHPWASKYRGVTFSLQDFEDMVSVNTNGKFILVILGEAKKNILEKFIKSHKYKKELPVSFLWKMPKKTVVYTDQKIS